MTAASVRLLRLSAPQWADFSLVAAPQLRRATRWIDAVLGATVNR